MNPRLFLGLGALALAVGGAVAWSYRPSTRLAYNWARVNPSLEPSRFMAELKLKQPGAFKGGLN